MSALATDTSTTAKIQGAVQVALEQYREALDPDAFLDTVEITVKLVSSANDETDHFRLGDIRAIIVRHTSVLRMSDHR